MFQPEPSAARLGQLLRLDSMIRTVHKAKFVLAEPDLLLQDAAIHVCDPGRISRVEPWQGGKIDPDGEFYDWGSAVIIPGLVNAHTHLELTNLGGSLDATISFTGWLTKVVQKRRNWVREDYLSSVRAGAGMAVRSGTTTVGDISAGGLTAKALSGSKIRRVIFEEVLGLAPAAAITCMNTLEGRLSAAEPDPLLTHGISPHAPYSVSPALYRSMAEMAREKSLPLATHLAETRAEIDFLRNGTGEFRDFLSNLGVLPEGWAAPGQSPLQYMDSLGLLDLSPLLIHCNYLDPESIARILGRRCSVIFCPRSHDFFGHEPHPVRKLLDSGINVGLGTDSLASNPSLSMLDEMRFLFSKRKDLKSEEIVRMATINGAAALGFGGALGRLRRGYWADMAVLRVPENTSPKYLTAQILEGLGDCQATLVKGEFAWLSPASGPGAPSQTI
jgi:aminodeoxyfutalosine deaminase